MARLSATIAKHTTACGIRHTIGGATDGSGSKRNDFSDMPWKRGKPKLVRPPHGQPTSARTLGIDAIAAVNHFIDAMLEEVGCETLSFRVWRTSYDDMATGAGWPPLSDKVLGLALQSAGCRRRVIDARHKGQGRYVAYELPARVAA